jgi:hypothetical protein
MMAWQHLVDGMRQAAIALLLVPREDQFDEKFARECGLAIYFGKPIILLVRPDAKVSDKLAATADRIVDISKGIDDPETEAALHDALTHVATEADHDV